MFISLWMVVTFVYLVLMAICVRRYWVDNDVFAPLVYSFCIVCVTITYIMYWVGQLVFWYCIK